MSLLMHKVALLKLLFIMGNGVGPFAALFLSRNYGLQGGDLATTVALMIASYLLGNLLGGQLPRRCSSRTLLLVNALVASLALLLSALMPWTLASIVMILLFMFSAGVVTPVFSVMTAQAAEPGRQVEAFAYLHLATNAGGVLLFIVGSVLLSWRSQYLLWFTAVVSLVCLLASAVMALPETGDEQPVAPGAHQSPSGPVPFVVIAAGVVFFALSLLDGQREYQFPLWLSDLQIGDAARLFGIAGIVNGLLVIALTQPLIALTRRWSAMTNLALAAICYSVGFGAYALIQGWLLVLLMVPVWTLGEILGITYMATLIARCAPKARQGLLFSLIPVLQAGARMLCVGLAVPMLATLGFSVTWGVFGVVGVCFGASCLLLCRCWREFQA